MVAVQILLVCALMFVIPTLVGGTFSWKEQGLRRLFLMWTAGQMLLWAGFQGICVPMIILKKRFWGVKWMFGIFAGVLLILSLVLMVYRYCKSRGEGEKCVCEVKHKGHAFLWLLFGALLLMQLILTGVMAYEEGDDAFYIATSTAVLDADTMYSKLPYTGGATGLDVRHGLAPFPVWVAVLASVCGLPAVTVSHIAAPMMLILMTYAIYYLIGSHLLEGRREYLPFFMLLLEVMILFGGYSTYSAENFLLVRTSQGKAVLANIIIPYLFLLFIRIFERVHTQQKVGVHWLLLALTMIAACLCSTLGALLTCLLLGIGALCMVICYRNWKALFAMAACCVVPVCVAGLYFVLG